MVSSPMTIITSKSMTALKQIKMKSDVKNLNFSRASLMCLHVTIIEGGLARIMIAYNDHAVNAELVATIISTSFSFSF